MIYPFDGPRLRVFNTWFSTYDDLGESLSAIYDHENSFETYNVYLKALRGANITTKQTYIYFSGNVYIDNYYQYVNLHDKINLHFIDLIDQLIQNRCIKKLAKIQKASA